jgi:hypothetical protein
MAGVLTVPLLGSDIRQEPSVTQIEAYGQSPNKGILICGREFFHSCKKFIHFENIPHTYKMFPMPIKTFICLNENILMHGNKNSHNVENPFQIYKIFSTLTKYFPCL